jgi:hypothetical protein
MSARFLRAALLGSVLGLAGCAAQPPEAHVTRFHLGQPIARGQITVEPLYPPAAKDLEYQSYATAVSAELARLGFTLAPGLSKSELVAIMNVTRRSRDTLSEGSPVSIGIGGGTFGRHVGVGGGLSFPIGKPRSSELAVTELSVQIKRRSDGTVIWEGRAVSEARGGTPYADPATAVRKLAAALFQGFPGESGRTITVK